MFRQTQARYAPRNVHMHCYIVTVRICTEIFYLLCMFTFLPFAHLNICIERIHTYILNELFGGVIEMQTNSFVRYFPIIRVGWPFFFSTASTPRSLACQCALGNFYSQRNVVAVFIFFFHSLLIKFDSFFIRRIHILMILYGPFHLSLNF